MSDSDFTAWHGTFGGRLTDPITVVELLSNLIAANFFELIACTEAPQGVRQAAIELASHGYIVADIIFGGMDRDYPPIAGWNERGILDECLRRSVPEISNEADPEIVVAKTVSLCFSEVLDSLSPTGERPDFDVWKWGTEDFPDGYWNELFPVLKQLPERALDCKAQVDVIFMKWAKLFVPVEPLE